MKKSIQLTISGSVHGIFFKQFVKTNADKNNVRGFIRKLDSGNVEIFLEGDSDSVDALIPICMRGPQHSQIREVEQKERPFQDFKEFKILKI